MAEAKGKSEPSGGDVVPLGTQLILSLDDIAPSRTNPRHLFDEPELVALRNNIRTHGVLVPITVYRVKGQKKYFILDGERRYRCCKDLAKEKLDIKIPANVVVPPTKIAGLLYMFSIHNFREPWELMPTALGLKSVMETLEETDNDKLIKLTGLSGPQIERCKILIEFEEKYQNLSLEADRSKRIPSNFWIELKPLLDLVEKELPKYWEERKRHGIIDALVAKYREGRIKSVIHFRRILEAYDVAEDRRKEVLARIKAYIDDIQVETRSAFDEFVVDNRRIQGAVEACDTFIRSLKRAKLDYTTDNRRELTSALERVKALIKQVVSKLEGSDEPADGDADA